MDRKQRQGRWVGLRGVVVGGCKLRREVVLRVHASNGL
jgi:hypothetical protein